MRRLIKREVLALLLALPLAIPLAASAENAAAPGKANRQSKLYIVQMADPPAVAYTGGIPGLKATKPNRNQKIDPFSADVVRYSDYLTAKHDDALRRVGGGKKAYSYKYSFNGFAAELSAAQAEAMKSMPGIIAVSKDELRQLDTSSTPAFLGLTGPSGVWMGAQGENVIIGVLDSGIWPESLSFSDRTGTNGNATKDGKLSYQPIPGWRGKCTPGEAFNASHCNQKLIGAQYYNAGFGGNAGIDALFPFEFNSPRDWDGHGTHTSSTAGGNRGVAATGAAAIFGSINGIAPRARLATYKVCWAATSGGCFVSDSVAAIDQALADGVDVINYSISATRTNFRDAVQVAFLFAADAGVFVAASAGNDGPASSTVNHPGPWLTTVAAGTHNRDGQGSVTLGNGVTYLGASAAAATGPHPLINASDAGLAGADPTAVRLCFAAEDNGGVAVLDPAKVAGKIVACDDGVIGPIWKSQAVQQAGGAGMILLNTSAFSLTADLHFVPTVNLQNTDRAAILAYGATPGATAVINQATLVFNAPAPFTASFSSRGPLQAGNGDLLKPDIIAPGQDILAAGWNFLAAVAPPGREFDILSGTSMSSPHVAGLGALLKSLHPNWSPMAIKSALMTTAGDVIDGGVPAPVTNPDLIFRQGAGHVTPLAATDPGLVYDSGFNDWLNFICGTEPGSFCSAFTPIDPSDLNVPSIAIGDMAGVQTVTRKVTNVGNGAATYTASVNMGAGISVVVTPSSLTLAKGETKSFTVQLTRISAALNAYTGGQLTWADGAGHNVRIPIVIQPVALAAPVQVSGTGAPITYNVTFGYSGPFSAVPRGLISAAITAGNVADDPTDSFCDLTSANAQLIPAVIPAGTTYARFSLFDADVNAGSDIDMCVFNAANALVGVSGGGTSTEEVNLLSPAAGTYTVVVQGWGVVGSSPFKLHTWLLGSADAGNMVVTAPAVATIGGTGVIGLTFSGLAPATKYLGSVAYGGAAGLPNPTIVRVDTP